MNNIEIISRSQPQLGSYFSMNPNSNMNVSNDNVSIDRIYIHSNINDFSNNVLVISSDICTQKSMWVVTCEGIISIYTSDLHFYLSLYKSYGAVSTN